MTAVGLLAAATTLPTALAQELLLLKKQIGPGIQPVPPGPTETHDPNSFSDNIDLPKDEGGKKKQSILAIYDYIREEKWEIAIPNVQKLVDLPDDVYVQLPRKGADGKESLVWTSVRTEANRIIANLPPKGQEFYRLAFDNDASNMLKQAKESGDLDKLSMVMSRYLFTEAGGEAANLLGTYHLDRGGFVISSLCFKRLLNRYTQEGRDDLSKLSSLTLFKSAFAFHQSGDTVNEDRVWKELNTRGREIKLGQESKPLGELHDYVTSLTRNLLELSQNDWPMIGGNPSRTAKGEGDTPFMEKIWGNETVRTEETRQWLAQAAGLMQQRHQPMLSGFFPVTATVMKDGKKLPLLVYRSHWGIHAVHMQTGKTQWEAASHWSMDRMVRDPNKHPAVSAWVNWYIQQRPSILLENSTVGTLSTDSNFAYMVEDLAVPPPPSFQNGMDFDGRWNQGGYSRWGQGVADAIQHSRLQAFDLITGKLRWELGGKPDGKGELDGCYFLGAPMPLAGKLYVLTEKQQELRLACIDPSQGKVIRTQTLANTRDKMQQESIRRIQAAHLAYDEGMLVCPTNAGAILGVDLLSNNLAWAYSYREKGEGSVDTWNPMWGRRGGLPPGWQWGPDGRPFNPNGSNHSQWQVTAPVIQDGKVVFTAPDAKSVHCINLRDGSRIWTQKRLDDDLYMGGVYGGKVIIVGKKNCRAVSLNKGETLWTVDTGIPSGQGIASENIYYLPIKEAASGKEPEICAIDMERGAVHAHTKSRKKEVPGNLLFYEGNVLSQTPTEVVAFPQLKVKLTQIDELIAKNDEDPVGLTERGELRLDKGDLQGAVDDLSKALKNKPDSATGKKAREKLYETLTEFFQRDFNAAEKYLKEYEDLCNVPVEGTDTEKVEKQNEGRKRRANFLCLVAKGKQNQGKLVEAFDKYQEYAALASKQELLSVVDEPHVRSAPDVWSQGRIAAMVAAAREEDRKPLENKINEKWKELEKGSNLDDLRNFVAVFGSLFPVGKEARLRLAERLMEDSDPTALLDAERHLTLLRGRHEDPQLAGRAVEALARLNTRKGMLKDAAHYYDILARDYGNVKIVEDKTGADLYNELATDKRFLPYLDKPARMGTGRVKATEERGGFPYQNQSYQFGQVGERLPFFQENHLLLRFDSHTLKLVDHANEDDVKMTLPLTRTMFQNLVYGNGQPNVAKHPYMTMGHLIVLPLGHMVFGIDPINKKVLWEKNLYLSANLPGQANQGQPPGYNQLIVDPRDGTILITYPDGWTQRLGQTGTLEGTAICLQTRDGLVAVDPVSGRTLWTRGDISSRCQIFTDEQNIYVVEMNTDNVATATRVLRAYDGVQVRKADGSKVEVPDFAALYQKRLQMVGRNILLADAAQDGTTTLRLYDVLAGKDLWKQAFPANSIQLKSEEPNLAGMIEPDGKVTVVDLNKQKTVLEAKVDFKHFTGATSVHLLSDGRDYFVAVNGPINQAIMPFGGVQTNLMPGTGMRALPVNGYVYSFNGSNGKIQWYANVPNQMIVLDHFADMPMVLFTARYQQWNNGPVRNVIQVVAVKAIEKRTGKLCYDNTNVPNGMNFHALTVDSRAGKIEFTGYQMKLKFELNSTDTK
jgi:outer membrane protein assembly factor BamB